MELQGRELTVDTSGDDVRLLQTELAQLGLPVPPDEQQRAFFGSGTVAVVRRFQAEHALAQSGIVDAATATAINGAVASAGGGDRTVVGHVVSAAGAALAGLIVEVVDKNVGQNVPVGQGSTDNRGRYFVAYATPAKPAADLQARVSRGGTFLGSSDVVYGAPPDATIDVVLPASAATSLPTEYEALTAAIEAFYSGALRDLKETDGQQDITYLANKTGWDARAVALAALADRFSADSADPAGAREIPAAAFYALFRAGVRPAGNAVYQIAPATLVETWTSALAEGLITGEALGDIPALAQRFQTLGAQKLLSSTPTVGASSLADRLAASGLDAAQQQTFVTAYSGTRTDPAALWPQVSQALGADTAARLQVDGKLGFLTLNNATLVQAIHAQADGNESLTDPAQLASAGYHSAEKWTALLTGGTPIPAEIPGDTPEAQRANYASYLAAQVRLSYPTASLAEMVQRGTLPVNAAAQVHDFLAQHQASFEVGTQPVEQYIAQNNLDVPAETVDELKRVQRVYQITPEDQAMAPLLERGLDSAYAIARRPRDDFIESVSGDLMPEQATAVHDRAVHVHNTVLNVGLSYLLAKTVPGVGVHSPAHIIDPSPVPADTKDVIAYSTLESLFGALDFCACEHCRSVLSPAAYLVDLLDFADATPSDTDAKAGKQNPQSVLLDRRPDVQHVPLTCENTNTALPYIDIVNEVLEYYVANGVQPFSLQGYTGHDTEGVASDDLLSTPQYVLDVAYTTLAVQRYPAPLPFDRALEELRRYFAHFDVPLPRAMETLRTTDDLDSGTNPYGWLDTAIEQVRISRGELELLTDSNAVPLWRLYGLPDGTLDADVVATVSNAEALAHRAGVTNEELLEVLKTRFVNPESDLIPKLARLGVPFSLLAALKTNDDAPTDAAFDKAVAATAVPPDPNEFGGDIKAWVKNDANYTRIMGLVTLAVPATPWKASTAYTVGAAVRPAAPDPGSSLFYTCTQAGASGAAEPTWPTVPGDTVTDGGAQWRCVDEAGCQSFADLSLRYASGDPVGADVVLRLGRFVRLWKKLGWTSDEVDAAISALLGQGFETLLPRLGAVDRVMELLGLSRSADLRPLLACWADIDTHGDAALYRRLFLSPALPDGDPAFADNGYGEFLADGTVKLADHADTVRAAFNLTGDELGLITTALGFDATTPLTHGNASAILRRGWLARKLKLSVRELLLLLHLTGIDPFAAPDPPASMVKLIKLVLSLREQGLKAAVALYLIWNQDLSGRSAPDPSTVKTLARDLRSDFASIADELSAEDAAAQMTLVYGQETSDAFFALLDETIVVEADYTHSAPTLEAAITSADSQLAYNDFRHRLSHSGLVTDALQKTLKSVPGVSADFQAAVDALHDTSQQVEGLFFNRFPELQPPYQTASSEPPEQRHAAFLAAFEPELAKRRKRQQALQRLSATAGVDQAFAQALLDPAVEPFPTHAADDPKRPLLDDAIALEAGGLAATFFYRDTVAGNPDVSVVRTTWSEPLPANPKQGAAVSGIWTGSVEPPEGGFYNLIVTTDAEATVTLTLGAENVSLARNGNAWRNADQIQLAAGALADFELKVEKVKNIVSVDWETPRRPREPLPARYLYASSVLVTFADAYLRLLKTASLASALQLSTNDFVHLATDPDYEISGDGWLNVLPVRGDPQTATANALLAPLWALLEFSRVKPLDNPIAAEPETEVLLAHLGKSAPDLAHLDVFVRVHDALALTRKLGISAASLLEATTNAPTSVALTRLEAALRARYDPAAWRDVVRPLNDELRALRRDALVAHILHQMSLSEESAHIDTPDKLFEYFLMDVEMDPCMETSRIRNALSSVQLFVERCLMNLEPRVSPVTLDRRRWEWMKRYRVWEANRKVFLWPENWLEPELRDDQSPFFKEAMSDLLQGDITDERAVTVLGKYLAKLSDVAKLEPCGIFCGDAVHVVARTAGAKRKHYYRRLEYGYWTPWEEVKLDIEDNPVVPVVWNDRLLLFWLRLLKKAPNAGRGPKSPGKSLATMTGNEIPTDVPNVTAQAVLCWSEHYNGSWQPTRTSDVNLPTELASTSPDGFDRGALRLGARVEGDGLRIYVNDGPKVLALSIAKGPDQGKTFYDETWPGSFLLYTTESLPVRGDDTVRLTAPPTQPPLRQRDFVGDPSRSLVFNYTDPKGPSFKEDVLHPVLGFRLATPKHDLADPWNAPFLYDDTRHTFYVTTEEHQALVSSHLGFGVEVALDNVLEASIGKLVSQSLVQAAPRPEVDGGPVEDGLGAVDPNAVRRLVSEDAYIHQAIASTGVVAYGDKKIGPLGSL